MMYSRGQFAVMGKVGRKALRLYHEEGLLVPAHTNEANGYHYYAEEQLAVLERIKRLRAIGLSLFEIRQVLDGNASEDRLVKGRIREMRAQLASVRELASQEDFPAGSADGKSAGAIPDMQRFERKCCLFIDENVEKEDLGMSVGRLHEKAAREGLRVQGSHFVIYTGLADENAFSMRTCLPVSAGTGGADRDGDGDTAGARGNSGGTGGTGGAAGDGTIDAGGRGDAAGAAGTGAVAGDNGRRVGGITGVCEESCLHLNFRGGFSRTGEAHRIIRHYAEDQGIVLADRVVEVYNRDMSVDVYWPLKAAPEA